MLFKSLRKWIECANNPIQATLIMLTIVTPALILHSLVYLLSISIMIYATRPTNWRSGDNDPTNDYQTTRWVCAFIGEITNGFIYLGVVLIGFLQFRRGARGEKERGIYVGGSANGQFAGADGGIDQTARGGTLRNTGPAKWFKKTYWKGQGHY